MSNDATGIDPLAHQAINPSEPANANTGPLVLDTAARLKLIRDAFGFSQRELAKRAGVTNSGISMIELGQVSPTIQSLVRILSAFPISLADFFSFKPSCEAGAPPGGAMDSCYSPDSVPRQLDARVEHLLVGEATPFITLSVDSCGLVLDGDIYLTLLSGNRLLAKGDSFYIPAGQLFRLINLAEHNASLFRCSLFMHKG